MSEQSEEEDRLDHEDNMSDIGDGDDSFQEPIVGDPERQQRLRWWLMRLTAISTICSYVAVSHCSFLMLDYGASNNLFNPNQLGLFNRAVFDEGGNAYGCVSQNGDERFKDVAFGAGRFFGVMNAMVESLLLVIAFWVQLVMRPDWAESGWRLLRCCYIVSLLCQSLAFSVFGSEVCSVVDEETFGSMQPIPSTCSMGAASILALINVFLLLSLSIMVCLVPAPIHPYFIRWSDDEENNDSGEEDPLTSDDDYKSGDDPYQSDDGGSGPYDSEDGVEMPKKKKTKKKKKKKKGTDQSLGEETALSKVV